MSPESCSTWLTRICFQVTQVGVLVVSMMLIRLNITVSGYSRAGDGRTGDCFVLVNSPEEVVVLEDAVVILHAGGSVVNIISEIQRTKLKKNDRNVAFALFTTLTRYELSV
ncbi:hypothetical protein BDQ12DRAFT_529367 [Crucibulum laeve]|uniref:Uncharacterized protein n=1 Tax=Crucibulum laeve TaxID=68775 RepID=A0A5C3LG46_9AGAR|nr:hypothetical protein BDQ12DRAFT_529367 [Crucibulum laeve]